MSTSELEENIVSEQIPIIEITENGIEGFEILCRLCANRSDHLIPIYSEEGISNDLSNKMNLYLPVKVSEADTLPLQCCYQCASTVLTWHELVIASVEADRRLRQLQIEAEKHLEEQNAAMHQDILEEHAEIKSDSEDDRSSHFQNLNQGAPFKEVNEDSCESTNGGLFKEEYMNDILKSDCDNFNEKQLDLKNEIYKNEDNNSVIIVPKVLKEEVVTKINDKLENKVDYTNDENKNGDKFNRKRRKKSEIIAQHFCDICSKGFTRKYDMQKHRSRKHKNAPNEKSEEPRKEQNVELLERCKITGEDGKESYQCETCKKRIHLPYNFIRHQTIHTGVREFFCHICGKIFRMSSGLNRHIKEFHCRIKNHACDICGREFAAKASLNDHKNIHTNERPFVCDVCGKSFKQKASLHIHKMFHTSLFRFSCSICGKKYRRARDLKVHSWLHTGHRPYACSVCGSMFRLSQDLKRHSKIHNKESEFICVECGASFVQERYLKNHKKIHNLS